MKRSVLSIMLVVLALSSVSCTEPGQTIFGTPIQHHVVAFNSSDFNVEVAISHTNTPVPPDDPNVWQDVPYQYQGSVGRASWWFEEGTYYVTCRRKATKQVYVNVKRITLDSNPENRVFEGHSVGAVINVTPGHWSFGA